MESRNRPPAEFELNRDGDEVTVVFYGIDGHFDMVSADVGGSELLAAAQDTTVVKMVLDITKLNFIDHGFRDLAKDLAESRGAINPNSTLVIRYLKGSVIDRMFQIIKMDEQLSRQGTKLYELEAIETEPSEKLPSAEGDTAAQPAAVSQPPSEIDTSNNEPDAGEQGSGGALL